MVLLCLNPHLCGQNNLIIFRNILIFPPVRKEKQLLSSCDYFVSLILGDCTSTSLQYYIVLWETFKREVKCHSMCIVLMQSNCVLMVFI